MTSSYEKQKLKQGYSHIIGCDEVGRGCLAGPVVAGAVVFPIAGDKLKVHKVYKVIKDSKLLSPKAREELSAIIKDIALAWSIAEVSSKVVDEINIHNASLLAMRRAVEGLQSSPRGVILSPNASEGEESLTSEFKRSFVGCTPQSLPREKRGDDALRAFLFVDGKFPVPNLSIDQEPVIAGDNKVLSVAAASIIAKVYRDRLMQKLHETYPVYNLAQHKGYATEYHRKMVLAHGLSPIHRMTFCQSLAI